MNEEPILDPRDAIIARQAIEIEHLKRAYNDVLDQLDKMNEIISKVKNIDTRFMRF